jgi:dTDP-N-acetylfucosamine:lipid II N-acetylfucosaminyltransferase
MILHITPDDKFIDMALRIFEVVKPGGNHCIVVSDKKLLTYVECKSVEIITKDKVSSVIFGNSLLKYDAIIIHCFSQLNIRFPKGIKVAWVGWGADYYDLIYNSKLDYLESKTRNLILNINKTRESKFKKLIKKTPYLERFIRKLKQRQKFKIINNHIDYFLPVLVDEFDKVSSNDLKFKPKLLDWNYGTLENDWLKGFENSTCTSTNILVGNSASPNNNHVEVFELLNDLNIRDKKVIVPLSYGDRRYRDNILSIGEDLLGKQYQPLVDFMAIEKYINTIASCSFVIMNHLRQQAIGNIVIMLNLGAKVFLNRNNPAYSFFKNKGAVIFSIEDLKINPSLLTDPLGYEDMIINRTVLQSVWSEKQIIHKTKILVNSLLES